MALFGVVGLVHVVEWLAQSPVVARVLLRHATFALLLITVLIVLVEAALVEIVLHLKGWVVEPSLVASLLSLFELSVSIFFCQVRAR